MDKKFMLSAIALAKQAAKQGEIPVGAVVVKNGEIIGEGRNFRESSKNALAHAEIIAINDACKRLGDWRLDGCEIYVTLEPCPMCAGAIINSRISQIIFGAPDLQQGSVESAAALTQLPFVPVKPQIFGGICEEECKLLLTDFFKAVRLNEKKNNGNS